VNRLGWPWPIHECFEKEIPSGHLAPTTPPTSTSQDQPVAGIILQAALDATRTIVFLRSDAKLSKKSPLKSNWTAG